ncbi:MAG: hypothetical protein R3C56_23340 [Pirellulaceae bacterium]
MPIFQPDNGSDGESWRRNPNTLDLTQQPLCLARDLRYWPIHQRGELVYRIEIPSLYRYFRVGYEEYLFLSLLDGQTTIPQACGLAAAQLGSRAPSAADATTICKWLLKNELAYLSTDVQPSRKSHRVGGAATTEWSWLRRFNPFWIKVPLPKAHVLMRSCASAESCVQSSRNPAWHGPHRHRRLYRGIALGRVFRIFRSIVSTEQLDRPVRSMGGAKGRARNGPRGRLPKNGGK